MDRVYNYWCLNDECTVTKKVRRMKDEALINEPEYCSECGEPLKLVGEECNCIALFSSKSPEEKKRILKKRASEHNRTKMKDSVAEIKRRIIKNSLNVKK